VSGMYVYVFQIRSGSGQDTLQEPMAVGAERFCNGNHTSDDTPWVDRRSGEGREKPLDARSAGPSVVEILGGGLCPAVGVVRG
jgi:hypothetical protein